MPRTPSAIGWASLALAVPAIASAQAAPEPSNLSEPTPAWAEPVAAKSEPPLAAAAIPVHVAIAPSLIAWACSECEPGVPIARPGEHEAQLPTVATFEEEAWAPPSVTAQPAPARDRYPRSLAVRKPILPPGVVEASALFGVEVPDAAGDRARYTALPRIRIGIPHAEVAVASTVLVHSGDPGATPERLGLVAAYGRYMFRPGATVGAELTARTPLDDTHKYQPRVTVGIKQKLGTRAAIDALVAGGIDEAFTATARTRSLAALGTLRLQAQAAHGLAFEARGSLGYTRRMHDDPVMPVGGAMTQDYGVRMVAGATSALDVIVGFDVLGAGATAYKLVSAGIAVRRLP